MKFQKTRTHQERFLLISPESWSHNTLTCGHNHVPEFLMIDESKKNEHPHLPGQSMITKTPTSEIAPPTMSPKSGLALSPSRAQANRNERTIKYPP